MLLIMTIIPFLLVSLPILAQAHRIVVDGALTGHAHHQRSFLPYDLQPRDPEHLNLLARTDTAKTASTTLKQSAQAPSALKIGKGPAAAPAVDHAASPSKGRLTRLPSAEKKLESVEQSQVSALHKLTHPAETLAGGEHSYYKNKLHSEFGSKYKQQYETQRDAAIAAKNDRTKNAKALDAEHRKVLGEEIGIAKGEVGVASDALGLVKNAVKPFRRRDIFGEDVIEELFEREVDLDDFEELLVARDAEIWTEEDWY